ncbi:MAG: exopolysaccharide Pel transporter PelG [Lachnospiraceae bacterium]|nr:exopolysaccharide Pel transporter PelG [Butyrivibrio sp.]MCM1344167.1 exopolysaccharide Pel transporter PelG [Muribaculaceae bacterium]MCM1411358.1 exopolysaccharide Pel transporter PelG [Lachnospiraceae bacterium]
MAGLGVRLNRIYEKGGITMNLLGFGYSMVVTVAPMMVVIGNIMLMSIVLGYDKLGYVDRNLFSATILYIFIFALLTAAPLNAVLSRYISDVIYEEHYEDIMPCYYAGLALNIVLSSLLGIPFCVREYLVGNVALHFVFTGYCGYIALVLVFYSMLYLSICKDYAKISLYFFAGMLLAFVIAVVLVMVLNAGLTYSMLLSLSLGFLLTAVLEMSTIRRYFKRNSNRYKKVFQYFKKYWKLVVVNTGYTLGLYIHNFVFWDTRMQMVVADSFVMAPIYDMATCLAMFTNISATVIFISRVEMHFHGRYKVYSEAVTGGRWQDIINTKNRMFRQLSREVQNLVRIQFIISIVLYLLMLVFLPRLGFSGTVLRIYPCLAAGYFILFVMYSEIIFLYYFNDLNGAVLTSMAFCMVTLLGSLISRNLSEIWYGLGLLLSSFIGLTTAYMRIRWVEKHLDEHVFCRGVLFPSGKGKKPDSKVYDWRKARKKLVDENWLYGLGDDASS